MAKEINKHFIQEQREAHIQTVEKELKESLQDADPELKKLYLDVKKKCDELSKRGIDSLFIIGQRGSEEHCYSNISVFGKKGVEDIGYINKARRNFMKLMPIFLGVCRNLEFGAMFLNLQTGEAMSNFNLQETLGRMLGDNDSDNEEWRNNL